MSSSYRYEFADDETELVSGLGYAGARFYNPQMGLFLTHDPAAWAKGYQSPTIDELCGRRE